MLRKSAVPLKESIQVIKKFMQYFEIEPLPSWSAKVWKEMSITLDGLPQLAIQTCATIETLF